MIFDFDYMVDLLHNDPKEFEHVKNQMIEHAIQNIENQETQQRIRASIWRTNQELEKIKNPVSRQARLEQIFYQQIADFANALNGNVLSSPNSDQSEPPPTNITYLTVDKHK